MKKILLSLGTMAMVVTITGTTIACSSENKSSDPKTKNPSSENLAKNLNQVELTFEDGHHFTKDLITDGGNISIESFYNQIKNNKVYSINREHEVVASLIDKSDLLEFIKKYVGISNVTKETKITIVVNNLNILNDSSKTTDDILEVAIANQKKIKSNSEVENNQICYLDFYKNSFLLGGEFIENHMPEERRNESISQLEKIVNDKDIQKLDLNKFKG